jgi:hypothetical protein
MADLQAFTRELMKDAERHRGTQLDWVAVDHWNTDNPHIHVLVRGRADDGLDLVISRDYVSHGFRSRAAERVTLVLGPRSEQEIRAALENEVGADRWTSLDRSLRDTSDEGGGVVDLRPGSDAEDPELRRLMIGRAAKLERLGMAEQVGPAQWTLKPGLEPAPHDLDIRGDIIKDKAPRNEQVRTRARRRRLRPSRRPARGAGWSRECSATHSANVQTSRYAAQTSRILRTFAGVEIGDRRNRASYGGFCAPSLQWRFSNLRNWQGGGRAGLLSLEPGLHLSGQFRRHKLPWNADAIRAHLGFRCLVRIARGWLRRCRAALPAWPRTAEGFARAG